MSDSWHSIGRPLAFVYAAGWFAGTWIFTLVSFAIISPPPPDVGDRIAHYAYERTVYPQLYLAVVCFAIAMLCLVGLGLVLRHSLGPDGARQQLMAAAFGAAGLFGAFWLFLTLGLLQAVVNVSQGASSETLRTLTDASALIEALASVRVRSVSLEAPWLTFTTACSRPSVRNNQNAPNSPAAPNAAAINCWRAPSGPSECLRTSPSPTRQSIAIAKQTTAR